MNTLPRNADTLTSRPHTTGPAPRVRPANCLTYRHAGFRFDTAQGRAVLHVDHRPFLVGPDVDVYDAHRLLAGADADDTVWVTVDGEALRFTRTYLS